MPRPGYTAPSAQGDYRRQRFGQRVPILARRAVATLIRVSAEARAGEEKALDREWWLRIPAVLAKPEGRLRLASKRERGAHGRAGRSPCSRSYCSRASRGSSPYGATGTLLDYPTDGSLPLDTAYFRSSSSFRGRSTARPSTGSEGLSSTSGCARPAARAPTGERGTCSRMPRRLSFFRSSSSGHSSSPCSAGTRSGRGARTREQQAGSFARSSSRSWGGPPSGWCSAIRTVERWSLPRALGSLVLAAFALVGISLVALILTAG